MQQWKWSKWYLSVTIRPFNYYNTKLFIRIVDSRSAKNPCNLGPVEMYWSLKIKAIAGHDLRLDRFTKGMRANVETKEKLALIQYTHNIGVSL